MNLRTTLGVKGVHPLSKGVPPDWASAWGEDRFGVWASIELGGVEERLRWIPPGRFLMGSPEDEPGRFDNEGPQHLVRISRGFWLSEYPCRQSLWMALMGENPSNFKDPNRPVETVSWDDCLEFMTKLNDWFGHEEANAFRFPSEAEWEYACRAGTSTASYVGAVEILGESNAPTLDPLACYAGNSGVGKEVKNAWNSSPWPEKQEAHDRAATHEVGRKDPNTWGLYDMLGNVWEWCLDGMRDYTNEAETDPLGETTRVSLRVVRGGSWHSHARLVRAASRDAWLREHRIDYFGFRLARGPMLSGKQE